MELLLIEGSLPFTYPQEYRQAAAPATWAAAMLEPDMVTELAVQDTTELIASAAILSGLSRLFAEKLLLLKDKTLETGGSIEIIE